MKKLLIVILIALSLATLSCRRDAEVASYNLSYAADNFEIDRRIVFYNGINGEYMLTLEGRCSIEDQGTQLEVTCKTGPDEYKKHFLGLSDNVTYFAEQIAYADVSTYRHKVLWKPATIIPDIDVDLGGKQ